MHSQTDGVARSNMRMQLTRPRRRWSEAGRPSNASLQLIRGRWTDVAERLGRTAPEARQFSGSVS
jgi:hypothetical protein